MIYLKKNEDGTLVSCCDIQALAGLTGTEEADLEVTEEAWAKAGYCAYADGETIVLGFPPSSLDEVKLAKIEEITVGYDTAMTATLTMPAAKPTPTQIALATLDFQSEDAEGLAYVRALLAARRDDLVAKVDAATECEAVAAIAVR